MGGLRLITTGIFLQVRLNSTRLHQKALLEICGKTVIEHAMDSLSRTKADVFALLTDAESEAALKPLARRYGFEVFRGSADDVLLRYADAVRHYGVDRYIRATGDNPLVSWELTDSLIQLHEECGADFSGYLGPPLGTCVELAESDAILIADAEAEDPYEREHVSPFLYFRPDRFRIYRPWAPEAVCRPSSKVTLDTPDDLKHMMRIYDALYEGGPIAPDKLVEWLRSDESEQEENGYYTASKTG
ncbi:MAG: NTP transferase domain-containing protein [Spirochaetales bacterium]|jgi:spore coat polysaccharide biosynthesis protein SpsF|nr:NTP transferase domain-containing protein [Spirochaetales bacterium]